MYAFKKKRHPNISKKTIKYLIMQQKLKRFISLRERRVFFESFKSIGINLSYCVQIYKDLQNRQVLNDSVFRVLPLIHFFSLRKKVFKKGQKLLGTDPPWIRLINYNELLGWYVYTQMYNLSLEFSKRVVRFFVQKMVQAFLFFLLFPYFYLGLSKPARIFF